MLLDLDTSDFPDLQVDSFIRLAAFLNVHWTRFYSGVIAMSISFFLKWKNAVEDVKDAVFLFLLGSKVGKLVGRSELRRTAYVTCTRQLSSFPIV